MALRTACRLLVGLTFCSLPNTSCWAADKPFVRLAPNNFVAEPGISPSLNARARANGDDAVHAIIQFAAPVAPEIRSLLATRLGIVLLEPVPDNAYFARVPSRVLGLDGIATENGAPETGIRAITDIRPADKLAAPLLSRRVERHVERNGRYGVILQFFGDVGADAQKRVLDAVAASIIEQLPLTSAWHIEVVPDALLKLAAFDAVKWIEPAPGPAEVDNDGVRGATGINSDAVNLGTPYGLSGTGVTIAQFEPSLAAAHGDFARRLTSIGPIGVVSGQGHATHVAGTAIGSGALSQTNKGSVNQWRGVAFGASLRGYTTGDLQMSYIDAANHAVTITTNSWGSPSHCYQENPPANCYNAASEFYDAATSGRRSDGTLIGLSRRILIVASAGNKGGQRDVRYADSNANGQYDAGEAIYLDADDSGTKTPGDDLQVGPDVADGTPLRSFAMNERLGFAVNSNGESTQAYYRDNDNSGSATVGDRRLTAVLKYAADSLVAEGDADIGTELQSVARAWGNTHIPNGAKNTLVVGNYDRRTSQLAARSSRGPAGGRLKPDVVAPGVETKSTWLDNGYVVMSGTSQATPAVAGAAAVLTEWYRSHCKAGDPKPSTLRALLIHAAEDLKTLPSVSDPVVGPNYAYGYGAVRLPPAVDLVPHHMEGSLAAAGAADAFQLRIGAARVLKVTLAWDDPPWSNAAAASPATGILQNDLDLELVAPDGRVFTPWQLDPVRPYKPATASSGTAAGTPVPDSARDRRNTVEQIVVPQAEPGIWTIRVLASTMNLPGQDYSVVSELIEPLLNPCTAAPGIRRP